MRCSLFATLILVTMKSPTALPVRVLTHNIRYAAEPPSEGERPWSVRKQLILKELHYNTLHNPESFICLQEVLHEQLVDILDGLGDSWTYVGVGRDDGQQSGEYSPIIYRKAVWQLPIWRTVWLNEDGTAGKKGWDAGSVRIVTIGTFRHQESKKEVVGLCTHLDNAGAVSRRESARIIQQTLDFATNPASNLPGGNNSMTKPLPFFLAGDLNSEVTGEAYQILNGQDSALKDAKDLAKWTYGEQNTFTGFDETDVTLIDFVFVGPREGADWTVEGYSVLPNQFEDGVYNSDHRAVVVDTLLHM